MKYGLPYMGSKNKIAAWLVHDVLPDGQIFVDLFAGGCAVTHCAMVHHKYDRYIINDISEAPGIFIDAIQGKYKDYYNVPTREEFYASDDLVTRLLYSFGNAKDTYLWGEELERIKVPASRMVSAPTMHERRKWYREFMQVLIEYGLPKGRVYERLEGLERLQGIERLEGLDRLQGIERLEGIERLQKDYREVIIPPGAVVYADPPYKSSPAVRTYGEFNYDDFESWLAEVPFPVYVSEYDCPAGCTLIAEKDTYSSMAANSNNPVTERVYVQTRYKDQYIKPGQIDFFTMLP